MGEEGLGEEGVEEGPMKVGLSFVDGQGLDSVVIFVIWISLQISFLMAAVSGGYFLL